MLVAPPADADAEGTIQLYNSDGSMAEISGNGTRCAAAFLIRHGLRGGRGASADGRGHQDSAAAEARRAGVRIRNEHGPAGDHGAAVQPGALGRGSGLSPSVWVGNPQCAVPVDDFDFDWRAHGRGDREASAFPESHQRIVHQAGRRAHHRGRASGSAGRGRQ